MFRTKIFLPILLLTIGFSKSPLANSYQDAIQILSSASRGDTTTIETLISNGADINYKDNTGMSIVCTAMMNSDMNAVQILQRYGADASSCNRQIKNRNSVNTSNRDSNSGFFSGLSNYQKLTLGILGAGGIAAAVMAATDTGFFNSDDDNNSGSSSGGGGSGGGGSGGTTTNSYILTLPPMPASSSSVETTNLALYSNSGTTTAIANGFQRMSATVDGTNLINSVQTPSSVPTSMQNYLLLTRAYNAFARGYFGGSTLRTTNNAILNISSLTGVSAGTPIITALITAGGIRPYTTSGTPTTNNFNTSEIYNYAECSSTSGGICTAASTVSSGTIIGKIYNNSTSLPSTQDTAFFDLTATPTGAVDATNSLTDTMLARILVGDTTIAYNSDAWTYPDDIVGMTPDGSAMIFKTGSNTYLTYTAMNNAKTAGANVISFANLYTTTNTTSTLWNIYNSSYTTAQYLTDFTSLINTFYGNTNAFTAANTFYSSVTYNTSSPFIVMPAGEYTPTTEIPLSATFENAAPLAYANLEHLFATTVAVQLFTNGSPASTSGYTSASDSLSLDASSSTGTSFALANSYNYSGPDSDGVYTIGTIASTSRTCGLAGIGTDSVDPWCFAVPVAYNNAAGPSISSQSATIMAGAFALVKSAFTYMTNDQIFLLLAMTSDGNVYTDAQLQSRYTLPTYYQNQVSLGQMTYENAFAQVFGYGVINLERATQPSSTLKFYSTAGILTSSNWGQTSVADVSGWVENSSYSSWFGRSAVSINLINNTSLNVSSAFNSDNIVLNVPFFDVVESDGIQLPRAFNSSFTANSFDNSLSSSQFVFNDFNFETEDTIYKDDSVNMKLSFRDDSLQTSSISGQIDNMSFNASLTGGLNFNASYGHNLSRISLNSDLTSSYSANARLTKDDLNNPYYALVSNAMMSGVGYQSSRFNFSAHSFTGEITYEELDLNSNGDNLMLSSETLGNVYGAGTTTSAKFLDDKITLGLGTGIMIEDGTILGSYGTGLLDTSMGATTMYIDNVIKLNPFDKFEIIGRYTMAKTQLNSDMNGFVNNISDIYSDSMTLAMNYKTGEKSFTGFMISKPLAINKGSLEYINADYEIVADGDSWSLSTRPYLESVDLSPDNREVRFQAVHQSELSETSSIAFGAIYRMNPNNNSHYDNETLLMMKFKQQIGF